MGKKNKTLGEIIWETVKDRGMTVIQFAAQIGQSRQTVYKIFSGTSVDTLLLKQISKVLNRDFFQLLSTELLSDESLSTRETLSGVSEVGIYSAIGPTGHDSRLMRKKRPSMRDRDELKGIIEEYIMTELYRPLVILEQGYTFGAAEVVEQVSREVYGNKGCTACPRVMTAQTMRISTHKVFLDHIDEHTFGSEVELEQHLSKVAEVQQETGKHIIVTLHLSENQSINDFFGAWKELLLCVEYQWNRASLLSWARDHKLHTDVLSFIEYRKELPEVLEKASMPQFFPTAQRCTAAQWEEASEYFVNYRNTMNRDSALFHKGLIAELENYIDSNRNYRGVIERSQAVVIEGDILINGNATGFDLYMAQEDAAVLCYLYDWAKQNVLQGIDEDQHYEPFDAWLKLKHPAMYQKAIDAFVDAINERLTEPGVFDNDEHTPYDLTFATSYDNDEWHVEDNELFIGGFAPKKKLIAHMK